MISTTDTKHETIAAYVMAPAVVITSQSYLLDRYTPFREHIHLPPRPFSEGRIQYEIAAFQSSPPALGSLKGKLKAAVRSTARQVIADDALFVDIRPHSPENWAHFLNYYIPLLAFFCQRLDLRPDDLVLVLPAKTPGYILRAADLFGLRCITNDGPVEGRGIRYAFSAWGVMRSGWKDWLDYDLIRSKTSALRLETPVVRAFLARRGARALENQDEIEAYLTREGFQTIYAEDLSVHDQLALFQSAEEIVGIHGAALAPLLFCPPQARPRRLVELMPVGHMVPFFRGMADVVGTEWVGVRGRIKPEYVKGLYDLSQPFTQHSLDGFSVDVDAIAEARQMQL